MSRQKLAARLVVAAKKLLASETWYHGSPHKFDSFKSEYKHTFGGGASDTPLFLTKSLSFAKLYARQSGFIYTVSARVKNTFDASTFIKSDKYWPTPREDLTADGQKLYDDLEGNRIFPELIKNDDDEWAAMHDSHGTYSSILKHDYDVMETSEMKSWLRKNGYDSFLVTGDGETNLGVMDPSLLDIVSVEAVS